MTGSIVLALIILIVAIVFIARALKVVPQQHAWIVERLGKYDRTLAPGLNILIPFIDRVAYRHSLKEIPLDVPSQICITRDNTQLTVDGVLYFQVTDPMRASYGSSNYIVAITQLSQTTLRSVIGKLELDRTFEEREFINTSIVSSLDEAAIELGRQGAALRDQGPDAAQRDPARDAGADHRRAREARADRGLGGSQTGADQYRHRRARRRTIQRSEGERQAEVNRALGEAARDLGGRRRDARRRSNGSRRRSTTPAA